MITQLQPITVVFPIPQDDLPAVMTRVRKGEELPVQVQDREQKVVLATGTLNSVDNQIDPSNGMVRLKAECPNEDNTLFPNQFVNVRLRVEVRQGATVMPLAAVQRGAQGTTVYAIRSDSTVELRRVQLGPSEGEDVVVEDGLAPGEQVVVDGMDRLRNGARVRPGGRGDGSRPDGSRPRRDAAPGSERGSRRAGGEGSRRSSK